VVDRWRAVGGVHPRDTPQAEVPILDHGERSFIALSYGLNLAELSRLAGAIEPVDQAAWSAAGGTLR
jgi:hypothetical protein